MDVLETILTCFKEPLSLLVHQPHPPITRRGQWRACTVPQTVTVTGLCNWLEMDLLFDHVAEMAALHTQLLAIWTHGSVEQIRCLALAAPPHCTTPDWLWASKSFLDYRDRFLVYAEYFVGQEQALNLLDVRYTVSVQTPQYLMFCLLAF